MRRRNAMATTLAALCLAAGLSTAGAFPVKPVTLVVPAAPGGPSDALARVLAEQLQAHYGQPFVVENRGGGNGAVGAASVARAAPDGHTILLSVDGPITVNPALTVNLAYDSLKDFQPVAVVGDGGDVVLAVQAEAPARTVKELVAQLQQAPDKANYVSSGVGFPSHIVAELFKREAGFQAQHVPVRGAGAAMQELLSGRMSFSFPPVSLAVAQSRAQKVRLLAIASGQRSPLIADVPTFAELGYAGVAPPGYWIATYVPAGTPRAVVDNLATQIRRITQTEAYKTPLTRQGLAPSGQTPDEIAQRVQREHAYWQDTIRKLGIKAD